LPNTGAFNNFASVGPLQSSASGARNSMGGMPVIDLTAGMTQSALPPAIYDPAVQQLASGSMANGSAIGSGVAPASWESSPNISVPAGDLASRLRPLEPTENMTLVPFVATQEYAPVANAPSVAMTQYRSEASASPAWQAVAPVPGRHSTTGNAFEQRSTNYTSQLPATGLPSTDPVASPSNAAPQGNAAAARNEALLWRNPAVAR
jgi:hypothetical protein